MTSLKLHVRATGLDSCLRCQSTTWKALAIVDQYAGIHRCTIHRHDPISAASVWPCASIAHGSCVSPVLLEVEEGTFLQFTCSIVHALMTCAPSSSTSGLPSCSSRDLDIILEWLAWDEAVLEPLVCVPALDQDQASLVAALRSMQKSLFEPGTCSSRWVRVFVCLFLPT